MLGNICWKLQGAIMEILHLLIFTVSTVMLKNAENIFVNETLSRFYCIVDQNLMLLFCVQMNVLKIHCTSSSDMPIFHFLALWGSVFGTNTFLCLSKLAFLIDSSKKMGTNYEFLWEAASNKLPKDTIKNLFFPKLFVLCRHNTGSSFVLSAFLMLKCFIGQC